MTKQRTFVIRNGRRKTSLFALCGEADMKMEPLIRAIAGTFVLASLVLGYFHSPYWHLFTAFVGLNLLQSAFTKWCLMEDILGRLGVDKSC